VDFRSDGVLRPAHHPRRCARSPALLQQGNRFAPSPIWTRQRPRLIPTPSRPARRSTWLLKRNRASVPICLSLVPGHRSMGPLCPAHSVPVDDPWLPAIEAFLTDKTLVTSTEYGSTAVLPLAMGGASDASLPSDAKTERIEEIAGGEGNRSRTPYASSPARAPSEPAPTGPGSSRDEPGGLGERAHCTMTQLADFGTAQAADRATDSLLRAPAMTPPRLTQAEQRELIRAALAGDPNLPDLRTARAIGCAVTTVARCAGALQSALPAPRSASRPAPTLQ
jgi:hypothetical protein